MTCLKCGVGVGLLFIALYLLPTPTLAGTTVDLTPHIWYDTGWVAGEMGGPVEAVKARGRLARRFLRQYPWR